MNDKHFKVINEHYIFNENTGEHLDLKDACNMLNRKDRQINALRRDNRQLKEMIFKPDCQPENTEGDD